MRCTFVGASVVAPIVLVMLAMGGSPARGGEYHKGTLLICSDCHTMHDSQSHNFDGTAPAVPTLPAGGPFPHALKDTINNVCSTCHDGQSFAPDVIGANTGTHVRAGGALPTGVAPYEEFKGHMLGSTAVAPGGTFSAPTGLSCINCHSAHGNTNYRNLRPSSIPVTYAKDTNDLTKDVFLRGWTLGAIATNYAASNADFNEPVSTKSAMAAFCKNCHTNFHGAATDANMNNGTNWLRHPTANAELAGSNLTMFSNASHLYRVKVMSPSGNWGTQGAQFTGAPTDLTPTCVSCHKAHGNQNPFGLIFATGAVDITEEGDGVGVRDLCRQCHNKGN